MPLGIPAASTTYQIACLHRPIQYQVLFDVLVRAATTLADLPRFRSRNLPKLIGEFLKSLSEDFHGTPCLDLCG
jgi:hypothetical protein